MSSSAATTTAMQQQEEQKRIDDMVAAAAADPSEPTAPYGTVLYPWRLVYMALFGATVGAYLDFTHTDGGEITYPAGTNHWRAILTFLAVYSIPTYPHAKLLAALGLRAKPLPYRRTVPFVFVYAFSYLLSSYGDAWFGWDDDAKLVAIGAIALVNWVILDASWEGLVGNSVVGVVGVLVEHLLCEVGSMTYTSETPALGLRVPLWLFFIYFGSCATWGQVCRRLLTTRDVVFDFAQMRL